MRPTPVKRLNNPDTLTWVDTVAGTPPLAICIRPDKRVEAIVLEYLTVVDPETDVEMTMEEPRELPANTEG